MDLSAAVASANAVLDSTLVDSVGLSPRVETADGAGGAVVTFGTEQSVPARVHLTSDADGAGAGVEPDAEIFTVVMSYGQALEEGDRIRWVDTLGETRVMYVREVKGSSLLIGRYAKAVESP